MKTKTIHPAAITIILACAFPVVFATQSHSAVIINDTFSDGGSRPVVKDGNIRVSEATTPGVNGDWQAASSSSWTHGPGTETLYVTSTWEGGAALLVDMATFSAPTDSWLQLSFDIAGATDPDDDLYVHLWGFVSNGDPGEPTINTFANFNSIGGMWESTEPDLTPGAAGPFDDYNLGGVDGAFTGNSGVLSDAAVAGLPGVVGSYSFGFDLSSFTTAPDTVGDYDYILIGFQRDFDAGTTTAFQIDNLLLVSAAPEPSSSALLGLGLSSLLLRRRRA